MAAERAWAYECIALIENGIARIDRSISRQLENVARLERQGNFTWQAREVLETSEQIQRSYYAHRAMLLTLMAEQSERLRQLP